MGMAYEDHIAAGRYAGIRPPHQRFCGCAFIFHPIMEQEHHKIRLRLSIPDPLQQVFILLKQGKALRWDLSIGAGGAFESDKDLEPSEQPAAPEQTAAPANGVTVESQEDDPFNQ